MCRRANGGLAYKDRTGLDGQGLGLDITDDFGAGFELDLVGGGHVAVNLAVDDYRAGLDFGLDAGVFTHGEISGGLDIALNLAIDDEIVLELDSSFDLHIGREDVASAARGRF